MDIFSVFTLLGGLAFFLFGMREMSNGLEKMAGSKLEQMLKKMTNNPFKSLLLGAGITIAIQSSSAMTVMLVGLVNSGIMELGQTVGVIMGSNIGTTLTAWILSLSGIESGNFFVKLLKPESFSPIVALIGIGMIMMSKNTKKRDIGTIMVGFAVLMYGMELMKDSMSPLAESDAFAQILTYFNNPLLGVLVGALFTGVIQSSAASVAILQALSATGGITFGMAIPIIMGQNIGTCVTALISSIGVNRNAKKVAVVHVAFNVVGTVICLILFYVLHAVFQFAFVDGPIDAVQIAMCHSIFNVATTGMLLPFNKMLVEIANKLIRDKKTEKIAAASDAFLDERLLQTPAFAVQECKNLTLQMAELTRSSINEALALVWNYDEEKAVAIVETEGRVDTYEDRLGTYLVKLSGNELSDSDSREVSKMLHCIGDLERISDHATNILDAAKEIYEKKLEFSAEAKKELRVAMGALEEILAITMEAFCNNDAELALRVEPLEEVIDDLTVDVKDRHIARLRQGACTIELGFVLNDLLNNIERVSDHCSNVAICVIQMRNTVFEAHDYLHQLKASEHHFVDQFHQYEEKYKLD